MVSEEDWVGRSEMTESAWRDLLFSDTRLESRLAMFRGILLPSLLAQTLPLARGKRDLIIFVAEDLPAHHRAALQDVLAPFDWAQLLSMPPDATDFPDPGIDEPHAYLRIDDDDALSRDFLSRLSAYVQPAYYGRIITHPAGYFAGLSEAGEPVFRRVWLPMIAMGIAYVVAPGTPYRSIYQVGPHFDAYRQAPTVIGDYAPAYVRTVHPGQTMCPSTRFKPDRKITSSEVNRFVPFDPSPLRRAG
jgi:hypothetical protein